MNNFLSESAGLKHCNKTRASIEYSNDLSCIYDNISEYNSNKNIDLI